jgi:aminoglycoside phosphotransferase (APT) family kinase protein
MNKNTNAETRVAEGYDIPAVETWISKNTDYFKPPFIWTRLEGGHSNLTYRLEDPSGKKAVIRRPPMGELLPKAHDMNREWSLIAAFAPHGFPVPEPIGFCDDLSVTGAMFYIMGFAGGRPLFKVEDTLEWVPEHQRTTLAYSFIDTLADMHVLDPDAIGLTSLGKKEDYIGRQIKAWYRSWVASVDYAELDDPRAHEFKDYFLENQPEQVTASVVHGDYYLHNCLFSSDSNVSAVLDWELATLGDPLADLGYTLRAWPEEENDPYLEPTAPTAVPGLPFRAELAQRYANRTGFPVDLLDYYVGFNHWKTAAILHGVYARYRAGQKSTEGVDMEGLREGILKALDGAERAIARIT